MGIEVRVVGFGLCRNLLVIATTTITIGMIPTINNHLLLVNDIVAPGCKCLLLDRREEWS